ncbi:MAG: extracellular solute-binding protein [Anaerolineales bacterium]|jgi:ABC-type glycerol-3-phosphate transport system substrate-binding protein|nr:extracellular solute-binding protein [Anaerolineales bacterium]
MKKLLTLLFITSILISACGAGETPTAAVEPSATQGGGKTPTVAPAVETASRLNVKEEALNGLEITVWTPWYDVEQSLFESLVRQFNTENEWGIKVAVQSQVSFAGLYESVTASLPTTEKPDMVIALPEHAQEWFANGVVTDLTDYVDDPKYGIDSLDIPIAFWEQDTAGDARVGVPAQRTAQVLLWNETWANELGFDSAPETPEDFREQACGARASLLKDDSAQNDALGGWLVDTEPMTAYSWMLAFGGGVLEEGNYRFLAPGNMDAFKYLRELSETSCAWQGSETGPFTPFTSREALFITVGLGSLPNASRAFASAASTDKWTVIPFPGEDGGVLAVYGSSYVILDSTDEEQLAAWLFARWLLDSEQDARWVEVTHLFPLRSSTLDLLGDYERNRPQWKQAVDLIPLGQMQPQLGSWRTVKIMLGDGFRHMYRVNVSSGQVAAILAQMESMAKDLSE